MRHGTEMAASGKRVAVVGCGIAGLSAAFRLQQAGAHVVIFERAASPGGRTRTRRDGDFVVDVGAGLLPATYVDVQRLIKDAQLDHLTESVTGFVATPRDGRLFLLDMRRPLLSLMASRLLTWRSKWKLLRLVGALIPARNVLGFDSLSGAAQFDVETIAEFVDRELNSELRDYFIEPLMRTLYLHNVEDASVVELLWCLKNLTSSSSFAIKGGMDVLASELARRFEVRYDLEVNAVEPDGSGCRLAFGSGAARTESFDGCVIAADAQDMLSALRGTLTASQQRFLERVRYSTSINLHYRLNGPLDNPGLIIQVPRIVDDALAALVQDHLKGSGRAPPGQGLVSAFFLTSWGEAMWSRPDAEIIADAGRRIEAVIPGFLDRVAGVHVERWRRAATIGYCGYYRELAQFEAQLDTQGPIQIASDIFAPSSVNVAVCQGERAAARLVRRFQAEAISSRA